MKRTLLIVMMALSAAAAAQQRPSVAEEFDFVMYLVGNSMRELSLTAVERTPLSGDSIDFLRGYTYYSAKMLDSACANFDRVSASSPLFDEAMFFAALSSAHLGLYDVGVDRLSRIVATDPSTANMTRYEMAGMRLLQRDLAAFDAAMSAIDTTDYRLATEAADLWRVRREIASRSVRRPWVAGTLSALVPGLGKVYAGNVGEGIAAFLVTGSLVAVTAENWVKEGPTNWKTITAGLLSAVFYVGNIYGSVATVKVSLRDFNQRNDVQILYDIHIPLRAAYRR